MVRWPHVWEPLALTVCVVIGVGNAHAGNILGVGIVQCSELVAKPDDITYKESIIAWVGGYVSGINNSLITREKKFIDVANLNADVIYGTVLYNCTQGPSSPIVHAVNEFIDKLPVRPWPPDPN
ncbi:hypothetical protein GCM10007881_61370 [Mesorhizobium huakuii]|uniref:hypothetical protein n=1 Tax=Mesorhizobium huakuii TaxID=28104 RepID=UPI00235CF2EC|nr:hypothetical protein [Mesorhizobium huakuii]GLQ82614.1 hypothetical protein GCM10007881_61370 [Mesorhizobium huakuii]